MSDSAKFFKRQSGQMKAVVAETLEALEATKEVVAKLKSDRPQALSIPPPDLVWAGAEVDLGSVKSGTVTATTYRATAPKLAEVPKSDPKGPRPLAIKPPPVLKR